MDTRKSFSEILDEKLGKATFSQQKVRPEAGFRQEFQKFQSPPHESWTVLLGIHPQKTFESQFPKTEYRKFQTPPKPRPDHTLNDAQQKAFETILRWKRDFPKNFSSDLLKKTFRQIALQIHPDVGGSAQDFIDLQNAKHVLSQVFQR